MKWTAVMFGPAGLPEIHFSELRREHGQEETPWEGGTFQLEALDGCFETFRDGGAGELYGGGPHEATSREVRQQGSPGCFVPLAYGGWM